MILGLRVVAQQEVDVLVHLANPRTLLWLASRLTIALLIPLLEKVTETGVRGLGLLVRYRATE